jgi:hypothetical protein
MSDNNSDPSYTKEEKASTASPGEMSSEVFDSSTYDSMNDLKSSATMDESEVNKVLSDTENEKPMESEAVPVGSSTAATTNARTSPTPTMEGRATTLKKSKQSRRNKAIPKHVDKQTNQIDKKIVQMLQPLQKFTKSADKQSEMIKQIQSQLKQLQKQVSQVQKAVSIGSKKKR